MACAQAFLPVLLLISLASVAFSFQYGNPCDCQSSCSEYKGEAQVTCMRICKQICSEEPGIKPENPRRGEREERHNPYFFGKERYAHVAKTEGGNFRVLENFSRRSRLLKGIDKHRVAILETEPRTFAMPSHLDADELFYVMSGEGTISILYQENRETYEIRQGDIMMIPAGSIIYQVNKHQTERLRIAMLLCPVSMPGHFVEFMQAGGQNPETFWNSFSDEILEAAFNAPRERFERVFQRQSKGEIFRASDEQIKALSKLSKGKLGKPFNILNKRPSFSNNHGQLFQVTSDDYARLKEGDVDVSIVNITRGSMMAPKYNSRATKIAIVVQGCGDFEMACPHVSRESGEEEERGREWEREEESEREWRRERGREREHESERGERGSPRIETEGHTYSPVRSRVCHGDVFVIPAAHPVVAVASRDNNLQILCFGIKAEDNMQVFLAGKNNVLKQMEKEAKELAFNTPATEVDRLLNAQPESVFFAGPGESRHGHGQGHASE
ncbi:hypothetical protein LUZ63_001047 [Rhynchospora breviuscula]|uniref:Cupin type-1 domain-containing protein n=1 Tax=Rhynchospora breviuscula TaxID=2022672 RepID=A0A9Q0CWK4_9POAL|nr:hypothetical protein LUZ63_001047 [Rhynchospora breviuscula]